MNIAFHALLVVLSCLPARRHEAGDDLTVVSRIQLDASLYLTGSAILIGDSSLVVTASGGLYGVHPTGWLLPVDTVNAIVSYLHNPQFESSMYTAYHYSRRSSQVIWVRPEAYGPGTDTLATIDSCFCFLENNRHAVLVHGRRNDRYVMWELKADGLVEVFNLPFPPSQVQMTGAATVLAAFAHKIVSIHKHSDPSIYFECDDRQVIHGFLLAPSNRFYISLGEGIMELVGGRLVPRVPGIKGKMLWQEGKIIVLDQEESEVAILVEG